MIVWLLSFDDEAIDIAKEMPNEITNDFPVSEMATTNSPRGLFYYGY